MDARFASASMDLTDSPAVAAMAAFNEVAQSVLEIPNLVNKAMKG
jgi:hypothetical protein